MNNNQETAISALQAWLESKCAGLFKTIERKTNFIGQFPQPALFIFHAADEDNWTGDVLQKTTVEAELRVFAESGADETPDTVLNTYVQPLRLALAPDGNGTPCTLGGNVIWARIEGRSEYFPGDAGPNAVAFIPVRILLP